MEVHPIYVLKAGDELSPVFESPLSLFDPEHLGPMIEEKYGIPRRRLTGLMAEQPRLSSGIVSFRCESRILSAGWSPMMASTTPSRQPFGSLLTR